MKKALLLSIILLAIILRFFKLGDNPPSLNWDEASLGYNAYSIAASLHDEYGEFLPLARFIAFGDYKPPGYIYAAAPIVKLFGLNELSVRFPSFLAGVLMVFICYLLVKELFGKSYLALLAAFLTAISPWAIHFSRAAFEANLAAFFNLAGIYLFILSSRKKKVIIFSFFFFLLSFYTFNANRIIAPLLLIGLCIINFRHLRSNLKWTVLSIMLAIFMVIPSVGFLSQRESKLRFQEVSIFNNLQPIKLSNGRIAADDYAWWAKIMHNRRVLFASDFLKHYFDNFSGRFLFTHGDVNPRLNAQEMGQLYVWDLPFLIAGICLLIKRREKALLVLSLWMIIAPIPAATARETPHALRILSILPTYQIITAYGIYELLIIIRKRFSFNSSTIGGALHCIQDHPRSVLTAYNFLLTAVCLLLSVSIFYYLHNYYVHFPLDWSGEWQYGYKQMVKYVETHQDKYSSVYVTEALGRPYIYFAFYEQLPTSELLASIDRNRDWFGFWTVKSIGNINFGMEGFANETGKILLVTTPGNIPAGFRLLEKISSLKGEDVFLIGEKV